MLTRIEVDAIAKAVLSEKLSQDGFIGSDVWFEDDFDGEEIIRVKAKLEKHIDDVEKIMSSVSEIRLRLLDRDDDRFVFLDQSYPGSEILDQGEEDEGDEAGRA